MEIAAIIIGILFAIMVFIALYISEKKKGDFDTGIGIGFIVFFLFIVEVHLVANVTKDPTPTAMDVYQGKTTLEYRIIDSVKIDSVVVWKRDVDYED